MIQSLTSAIFSPAHLSSPPPSVSSRILRVVLPIISAMLLLTGIATLAYTLFWDGSVIFLGVALCLLLLFHGYLCLRSCLLFSVSSKQPDQTVSTEPPTQRITTKPALLAPVFPALPSISTLSSKTLPQLLQERFFCISPIQGKRVLPTTKEVSLRSHLSGVILHCLRGHPFDDTFLSPQTSSLLILTNSDAEQSLSIGRALAIASSVPSHCWSRIVNNQCLQANSLVSGLWGASQDQPTPRARALIIMNPPSIENLIPDSKRATMRRAVTFNDFSCQQAFHNLIQAYLDCMQACRRHQTSNLQIEILGLHDLSDTQDEFVSWEAICQLAILEAIYIDEHSGQEPLTSITLNHQKQLPLHRAISKAFCE